ncbi:MAG: cob(I)yrinic acid a,c-diamide adenosyltransferase [Acholeplasmataceae bacterium]|jgi:cob(I)alamin adenosyltransferase|nr:cob(I)yrinic acid a,c-diamide adenosyltransferase [Acholeplasmataceae bacterium]
MKIYTKKGDLGKTDLIKERVLKTDLRIEVNGVVDELNAYLCLAKLEITDQTITNLIDKIKETLRSVGFEIAANKTLIKKTDVEFLEAKIDQFEEKLLPLSSFIEFDQNKAAAIVNIARTVTRRAERLIVRLHLEKKLNQNLLKYFNRLSDLLFVVARLLQE